MDTDRLSDLSDQDYEDAARASAKAYAEHATEMARQPSLPVTEPVPLEREATKECGSPQFPSAEWHEKASRDSEFAPFAPKRSDSSWQALGAIAEHRRILDAIQPVYESWLSRHPCNESTQWHVQNFISDLRHEIGRN